MAKDSSTSQDATPNAPASWGRWVIPSVVGLALAGGLSLRLWVAWHDVEELVTRTLQDDAFYYFLTAQRITDGQGISFDGVSTSNGYHPLWLFFLVPIFLLPGRDLPVHAALTGAAVLDVTAAALVALAVRRLTGHTAAGLLALFFYLFLPRNVYSGVNGLETSLASVMLALLLLVVVSVWRDPRDDWRRWSVLTGALGGLATLARLDAGVVVLCLLGLIALSQRGRRRWQAPALALGALVLVLVPWFLWSLVAIGTPVPVSGEASTWLFKEHHYAANPDASLGDDIRYGWDFTQNIFRNQIRRLYFPDTWLVLTVGAGVCAVAAHFVLMASGDLKRKAAGWLIVAGVPLAGFVAVLLYHTLYRWFFREWYFAWGMPILALLAGVLFGYVCEMLTALESRWRPAFAVAKGAGLYAALGLTLVVAAAGYIGPAQDIWPSGRFAHQRDRLEASRYLKDNTEEDARVAAFNAGILGYFSQRTVVNIDGVVNPDAYDALREHRLLAYLRSVGVEYVADRDQAWLGLRAFIRPDDWSESLWGEDPNASMVRVEEIGIRLGFFGQMTVFRIVR